MQRIQPPGSPRRQRIVVPTRNDALLRHLTEVAGGPLGRRTAPGIMQTGFFTVERVLLLITVAVGVLAVLFKDHCRRSGWTTPDQYTTACYSAFPNQFSDKGLAVYVPFIGSSPPFGQGPLAGWIAAVTGHFSAVAGVGGPARLAYFDVNAVLVLVAWGVAVLAVARSNRRRPWDGALVAASPLLLLTALAGADLWPAALVAAAVWAFSRRRTLTAGVLVGLGFSIQPYAGLFLIAIALLALRSRRYLPVIEATVGALLSAALVALPILVLNPAAYGEYWMQMGKAQAVSGSLYRMYNLMASRLGHETINDGTAAIIAAVLLTAAVAGVAAFALRVRRQPRLVQILALLVLAAWLVSPGSAPQQLVWLVPLLALARPGWRPLLGWQITAILAFLAWQLFQGRELAGLSPQHSIDAPYFILAMLLSMAATLAIGALIIGDMFFPDRDPVRRSGSDDPQAGEFLLPVAKAAPGVGMRALPLDAVGTPGEETVSP